MLQHYLQPKNTIDLQQPLQHRRQMWYGMKYISTVQSWLAMEAMEYSGFKRLGGPTTSNS